MHSTTTNKARSNEWRLLLFGLTLVPLLASCGMVDSNPPSAAPVIDVQPYYAKLLQPGVEYRYATIYQQAPSAAASSDTLHMEMYGRAPYDHMNMPTYGCEWKFLVSGYAPEWYYCLVQDSAVDLGDHSFGEHWTDLKAPLAQGKSWTFTRETGENVTAKITDAGASVKVNGQEFNDVIAVQYTGDKGTTSVRWFAKNYGLVFGHTHNADGSVSEEKFIDMKM